MTFRLSDIPRRLLRRTAKPTCSARLGIECLEDRVNPTPAVSVVSLGDVDETAGTVTFRFTRTETGPPPTVNFTLGGSASAGQPPGGDYYHNGMSVTFPGGSTTVDKTMTVFNDSTSEYSESIVLAISDWGGSGPQYTVGMPSSATAFIHDNDQQIVTVQTTVNAQEGEDGVDGEFWLTRQGDKSASLTVNYSLGGTAVNGTDFVALSGSVVFEAGAQSANVSVDAFSDIIPDLDETVILTITTGTGYTIGTPNQASMTIQDTPPTPSGAIGGMVWEDSNGNGVQDTGEPAASNVGVALLLDSNTVHNTVTDATGSYNFAALAAGSYTVHFVVSPGQSLPTSLESGLSVQLAEGQQVSTADAGILSSGSGTGSIGNLVWSDSNGNGTLDAGEQGAADVPVELYRLENGEHSGVPISTTTTDANGNYSFTGLAAGEYIVTAIPLVAEWLTSPLSGEHSVTLLAGQAYTSAVFGLDMIATEPSITLDQPTVEGKKIKAKGTFDLAGAEFARIEVLAVPVGGGQVFTKKLTTAPGGNAWNLTTDDLPKGKYQVSANLIVKKGGQEAIYSSKTFKNLEVVEGQAPQGVGSIAFLYKPIIDRGMTTNTVVGTAKYSLPTGYTVESAFARISSVNGGFEWHLAMTSGANPPGVTDEFQIGKIKAGKLDLQEIKQEPAGTKYRIEPVMIIKDANGNTFVVSGPAIEIEAR